MGRRNGCSIWPAGPIEITVEKKNGKRHVLRRRAYNPLTEQIVQHRNSRTEPLVHLKQPNNLIEKVLHVEYRLLIRVLLSSQAPMVSARTREEV